MDELKKGLEISLCGPLADAALAACQRQIEAWGFPLPTVQPLVLDFGLGDFATTGLIEFWIANEVEAGYCAKYLFVFDGQSCPLHFHRTKHETFFVLRGCAAVTYDDRTIRLMPGGVLPIRPGKMHGFKGVGPMLLLEVSQACLVDDNYFADPAIPIGGNYCGAATADDVSAA